MYRKGRGKGNNRMCIQVARREHTKGEEMCGLPRSPPNFLSLINQLLCGNLSSASLCLLSRALFIFSSICTHYYNSIRMCIQRRNEGTKIESLFFFQVEITPVSRPYFLFSGTGN